MKNVSLFWNTSFYDSTKPQQIRTLHKVKNITLLTKELARLIDRKITPHYTAKYKYIVHLYPNIKHILDTWPQGTPMFNSSTSLNQYIKQLQKILNKNTQGNVKKKRLSRS